MKKNANNVIMGPWGNRSNPISSTATARDAEYWTEHRTYEQCCIQQEQAFLYGKYYQVFVINGDTKRCFVKPCSREEAKAQLELRGVEL